GRWPEKQQLTGRARMASPSLQKYCHHYRTYFLFCKEEFLLRAGCKSGILGKKGGASDEAVFQAAVFLVV
ncbi:MAG: hypothetical protein Q3W85_00670, partial [Oscillospiraceae bacterium]|nr:hypothetical protein [Oscillospiraceae bacterium]